MEGMVTFSILISKAIRDTIPIIDPEEDYLTIAAAEEQMAITEAARKKELDEAQAKMRGICYSPDLDMVHLTSCVTRSRSSLRGCSGFFNETHFRSFRGGPHINVE